MAESENILHIAEILYENSQQIRFRFSRYLSADQTKWLRHGLFESYHKNGNLASRGNYEHDLEEGRWEDFHENGILAATGNYTLGKEIGLWQYWNPEGKPEKPDSYSP